MAHLQPCCSFLNFIFVSFGFFQAKHIFSFAEHKALEKKKNLEFAKPEEKPPGFRSLSQTFWGPKAESSSQDLNSTRGPPLKEQGLCCV